MEALKTFINPDLYSLLETLQEKNYKVVDILFDKWIKVSKKKGEFTWSYTKETEENIIDHTSIPLSLALIDINKPNTLLGILYNSKNKKPYKVIQVANIGGTKFMLDGVIESKLYTESEIFEVIEDAITKVNDGNKLEQGLRQLMTFGPSIRTTGEILGSLEYDSDFPASIIKKATANLPVEIYNNPVTTLLRINTYIYDSGLNNYLNLSNKLFSEIAGLTIIARAETELHSHVFNAALSSVKDPTRKTLLQYTLSASHEEVTRLLQLLESVKNFGGAGKENPKN